MISFLHDVLTKKKKKDTLKVYYYRYNIILFQFIFCNYKILTPDSESLFLCKSIGLILMYFLQYSQEIKNKTLFILLCSVFETGSHYVPRRVLILTPQSCTTRTVLRDIYDLQ